MSTRSSITVQTAENKWKSIYCHYDGYPSGVGQTLKDHYSSQEKAEALIAMGDCSQLADTIKDSVFYGRDRGEADVYAIAHFTLLEVDKQRWNYVWDGSCWKLLNGKDF